MPSPEPSPADDCASRLKVLADETRLAVVRQLLEGPRHVGGLVEALEIEQSLLSHHLKILRDAQLVTTTRQGKAVVYHLAPDVKADLDRRALNLGCCRLSFD